MYLKSSGVNGLIVKYGDLTVRETRGSHNATESCLHWWHKVIETSCITQASSYVKSSPVYTQGLLRINVPLDNTRFRLGITVRCMVITFCPSFDKGTGLFTDFIQQHKNLETAASHWETHRKQSIILLSWCWFFGLMYKISGSKHLKWYGCLFTSSTTKAVHTEIIHSLNTDSLI